MKQILIASALALVVCDSAMCDQVGDSSLKSILKSICNPEQLTPDQKSKLDAAVAVVSKQPDIDAALNELTVTRRQVQLGKDRLGSEPDKAALAEYRKLQRATEDKLRTALVAAEPALEPILKSRGTSRPAQQQPEATPGRQESAPTEDHMPGEGANMSAVRSVTASMWNDDNLDSNQKLEVEAALASVLAQPEIIEVMGRLGKARKAHQAERAKFPAERDNSVSAAYRNVQAEAVEKLRASLLAANPSLAKLMTGTNEGEDKTDSESGNKKAMKPIADVPGLPRVLIIGDSISIGYTLLVRDKLKDKANVHRIPVNGGATEVGLENMKAWLGDGKWDVIHFNFGLHDAKYASATEQRASREQYVANLQQLIDLMNATGAKLIFATTTPIPEKLEFGKAAGNRVFDSIPERNALAVELMKKNGVAVNDLYALILPKRETACRPGDVHFTPEGYELLAGAVASSIEQQLPAKSQ